MKVVILTEGGRGMGFGHISRCAALYDGFKKSGARPLFLARGDRSITGLLKPGLPVIFDWLKEKARLDPVLAGADTVVVDSYAANRYFYEKLSKMTKLLVCLDDNLRLGYPQGLVVNGNLYAKQLGYKHNRGRHYLLGSDYTPLRREFWQAGRHRIRERVLKIMLTFGGDDLAGAAPSVLKLLVTHYPDIVKTVIIGRGFRNVTALRNAADSNSRLVYYPSAATMKKNMLDSDIAISAAGQTLYELARVGLPCIAIAVASNQLRNARAWDEAGFIEYAGFWKGRSTLELVKKKLGILMSKSLRQRKSEIGQGLCDGRGTKRIIAWIRKQL